MKKAFSIIELIISIALIALMFGLYISKENIIPNFKGKEIRLETLKMDLISAFPFEKSLRLVCTNKDLQCFVVVDGIIKRDTPIKDLFEEMPTVYKYNPNFEIKYFNPLELDQYTVADVFFDFMIDEDHKTNDMVLFYKNKYYIYNALHLDAKVVEAQEDITAMFDERLEEIKDAFSI